MTRRQQCALQLDRYCHMTQRRHVVMWDPDTWEGSLHLSDESGVKRLREGSGRSGSRDIGPGCETWRELETFLRGMVEAEYLRRDAS